MVASPQLLLLGPAQFVPGVGAQQGAGPFAPVLLPVPRETVYKLSWHGGAMIPEPGQDAVGPAAEGAPLHLLLLLPPQPCVLLEPSPGPVV